MRWWSCCLAGALCAGLAFSLSAWGAETAELIEPSATSAIAETPLLEPDSTTSSVSVEALRVESVSLGSLPAENDDDVPLVEDDLAASVDHVMSFGEQAWVIRPWTESAGAPVYRLTQVEAEQPFDLGPPAFGAEAYQPFDPGTGATPGFGGFGSEAFYDPLLMSIPAVGQVDAAEAQVLGTTDVASLLQDSNSVQTVSVQQRSPVAFDPHVRGYNLNQIYTLSDGAFWTPVREDLDSMLSKIDPSLIQDVVVIPGPYGLRYGPGFSFIDVVTRPTPRYDGYESHSRTGLTYRANGEQVYGRETVSGGNCDYGYLVSYGNRTGNDYQPGASAPIAQVPASYHNQNFLGQLGYDLSDNLSLETRYQRLDQTNTEYAAQFFDVRYLTTDAVSMTLNYESPCWDRRTEVSGWFNSTRFNGDTENESKQTFNVINRVENALGIPARSFRGDTFGDYESTGARTATTWGASDCAQLTLGGDLRYAKHQLHEVFDLSALNLPAINTNLPDATLIDPGTFAEFKLPAMDYWTITTGARADWVQTDADETDLRRSGGGLPGSDSSIVAGSTDAVANSQLLSQSDMLLAFYLNNDVQLSDTLKLNFGGGHAQRSPTLRERYADGIFLGIIQNGFSRVIGNPSLQKERAWQLDAGIEQQTDYYKLRFNAFGSWIDDYITYTANQIQDPTGARLLQTINTTFATLAGCEASGEVSLTEILSTYGSLRYVDGRDHGINRPLAQIAPLDARLGLRWTDPTPENRWGADFGMRMVSNQDKIAFFRAVGGGAPVPVESPTPGFTTFYVRGYYNISDELNLVGGIDNLFDRAYFEHLDLRLPDQGQFTNTIVYSPGITPYFGVECIY